MLHISCLVTLVFMFVYLLCPFSAFPLCLPSQLCSHVFFPIPVSSPCLRVGPASCFILTVPCPFVQCVWFCFLPASLCWTNLDDIERNMFDVTYYISVCFGVVRDDQEEAKNVQNPPKKVHLVWVELKPSTFFLWCNITVPTHHAIKPKY